MDGREGSLALQVPPTAAEAVGDQGEAATCGPMAVDEAAAAPSPPALAEDRQAEEKLGDWSGLAVPGRAELKSVDYPGNGAVVDGQDTSGAVVPSTGFESVATAVSGAPAATLAEAEEPQVAGETLPQVAEPAEGADEEEEENEDEEDEEDNEEEGEEDEDDSDDDFVPSFRKEGGSSEEDGGTSWRNDGLRAAAAQRLHSFVHQGRADLLRELVVAEPGLLQETDRLGRQPLHLALLRCQPEAVQALLEAPSPEAVRQALRTPFRGAGAASKDSLPTLHLALAGAPFERTAPDALRCLELLLAQEAACPSVNITDNAGRTALHLACLQGAAPVLDVLLERRADPGACDDLGQLPLHLAIDSRSQACVRRMVAASDPSLFMGGLLPFYRCIDRQAWQAALLLYGQGWPIPEADINSLFDYANARGLTNEWNSVSDAGLKGAGALEGGQLPGDGTGAPSTALVTHTVCLGHGALPLDVDDPSLRQRMIKATPENPHRLEVLCGENGLLRADAFRELRWVGEASPAYLADILRVHEDWYVHGLIERVREAGPFSPVPLDGGDTKVTKESWNAALRACGCVLEAVELVCNEQVRNAFCAVRPPGHHLGPGGACNTADLEDDPEGSQGFCLLNNVAVGAAYARCVYRHMIRKVAIVDFDVHHGNGTEAVVRRVKWKRSEAEASREITVRGVRCKITTSAPPSCKPWLDPESDAESIFFASIHGYGNGFYPGTGANCDEAAPRIVNVALRGSASSADFRAGVRERILPPLLHFDPDILFISAGFDGHEDDLIGNCRCVEEDYIWVTKQLMSVANRCCQGRLISVLEGGYNTRAEVLSPFAQSVAGHIQTLMHTSPNYCFLECEQPASDDLWPDVSYEARAARRKRRRAEQLEQEEEATGEPASKVPCVVIAPPEDGDADMRPAGDEAAGMSAKEAEEMRLVFGSDDDAGPAVAAGAPTEDVAAETVPQDAPLEEPPEDAPLEAAEMLPEASPPALGEAEGAAAASLAAPVAFE